MMHAKAPSIATREGAVSGRWGYPGGTAGFCLPLHSRDLSPTRGKVPAAGKWQEYSKANSPGALPPARAAEPRCCPIFPGAARRWEEEEGTEEERAGL